MTRKELRNLDLRFTCLDLYGKSSGSLHAIVSRFLLLNPKCVLRRSMGQVKFYESNSSFCARSDTRQGRERKQFFFFWYRKFLVFLHFPPLLRLYNEKRRGINIQHSYVMSCDVKIELGGFILPYIEDQKKISYGILWKTVCFI